MTQPLNPKCVFLVSKFAFEFSLYRYGEAAKKDKESDFSKLIDSIDADDVAKKIAARGKAAQAGAIVEFKVGGCTN